MTREEVIALPAGNDLDDLVAAAVMGYGKWQWCEKEGYYLHGGSGWNWSIAGNKAHHFNNCTFSQDALAAWSVAQHLVKIGYGVAIESWLEDGDWCVTILLPDGHDTGGVVGTFPHALCRAALLAVQMNTNHPVTTGE